MAVERLGLAAAEGGPATDDAFEWTESCYDTRWVLEREKQLHDGGFALTFLGWRRESDLLHTSSTVFRRRVGGTTIYEICCRRAVISI